MRKSVIFLHIPKTAGTTLHNIIANQYGSKLCLTINDFKASLAYDYSKVNFNKVRAIAGHIDLETVKAVAGFPVITMLRNPRERVISQYRYATRLPKHPKAHILQAPGMDLKKILQEGHMRYLDNCHVRFLSGAVTKPFGEINEADFLRAQAVLGSEITVAGVVDYFDEFLIDCKQALGWKNIFYLQENKSEKKPLHFDAETEALIKKYNSYDQQLYEKVLQDVKLRIQNNPDFYENEKSGIRRLNKMYAQYRKLKSVFVKPKVQGR